MSVDNNEAKIAKVNYGSNSHKVRDNEDAPKSDDRKPVEKIISGAVIERKKSLGEKIAETFKGDDMQSVGSYILFDVILPETKSLIANAATQSIERMFFGESGGRRSSAPLRTRNTGSGSGYNAYNRYYQPGGSEAQQSPSNMSSRARATHDFREIILETRAEAQDVLDGLDERIDQYGTVTVADLYDLVGISSDFTDNKWGWRTLQNSGISRMRNGFRVDLPRTVSLD